VLVVSATDEIAVSAPLQDEVATDAGEQKQQEEFEQSVNEETPPPIIADVPTSNNVNEQAVSSNGKRQQETRKKRATKDESDALQQVDAAPGERKRARPRARKKSQAEE
jgi:hypothetical protein